VRDILRKSRLYNINIIFYRGIANGWKPVHVKRLHEALLIIMVTNYTSKYQQVKTSNTAPTKMHDTAESAMAQLSEGSITNI